MKAIYGFIITIFLLGSCNNPIQQNSLDDATIVSVLATRLLSPRSNLTIDRETRSIDNILMDCRVFQIVDGRMVTNQSITERLRTGSSICLPLKIVEYCDIYVIGNMREENSVLDKISTFTELQTLVNSNDISSNKVYVAKVTNVGVNENGTLFLGDEQVRELIFKRNTAEINVTVKCNKPGTFIQDIRIFNAAKNSYYIGNQQLEQVSIIDTVIAPHRVSGDRYTWHLPPNSQGDNLAITEVKNRYKMTAPTDLCTYVRIEIGEENNNQAYAYDVYIGNSNVTNFDVEANYCYDYEVIINNTDEIILTDNRIMVIDGLINLNKHNRYANCYVCRPGVTYYFDARIRGNGSKNYGTSNYASDKDDPMLANTLTGLELIWESTTNGTTNSNEVIDGMPTLKDGIISFKTGGVEGNAVIAILINKDIVWSWHIWVTRLDTHKSSPLGYMTMNIGATQDISGDSHAAKVGMLYQWGRKDPFRALKDDGTINNDIGDGIQTLNIRDNGGSSNPLHNLVRCIRNPAHLLTSSDFGWYSNSYIVSDLWGNQLSDAKTAFDPCPYGWKIPKAASNIAYTPMENGILCTNDNNNFLPYYNLIKDIKVGTSSPTINYMEKSDKYWTATYNKQRFFSFPYQDSKKIHPGSARAVRCIRDN